MEEIPLARNADWPAVKSAEQDHVIPVSKGGTDSINNAKLASRDANRAKHDLSVEELISLCREILEYNGYSITKK